MQDCLKKKTPFISSFEDEDSCLVAVYLKIEEKGVIKDHAIICLPNFEDFTSNKVLCEPQHEDINAKIRKQKRLEHTKLLKKTRRSRIKLRKKMVYVSFLRINYIPIDKELLYWMITVTVVPVTSAV